MNAELSFDPSIPIEEADSVSFEQYLAAYYDQYKAIRTGD